ncbi:MAG: phage integrase SAM-like domain-containing protein [Reichenbachiella sp.]|uniref:phage integrase SAM-like domain-containing protein n=1 Tax=Reichenbachiella sp. TaxID=2184521 RepID=UPI003267558D
MAKVRITLDTRTNSQDKDGKYPLVLRISHKSKTRDIGLDIHVCNDQFDEVTCTLSGIQNSVRQSKRVQKMISDIDLWIDENKGEIKLWPVTQLKDTIEKRFFNKQSQLRLLEHAGKVLYRFHSENQFSSASSYEDALKVLVKYKMKLANKSDAVQIKTLFEKNGRDAFSLKDEYLKYDMPIKAFNVEFARNFKAYLGHRLTSKNSVAIHLRSLQSMLNDAEKTYEELKGHKPLEGIKKSSTANVPVVLSSEEVEAIRDASYPESNSRFHVRNYFLFMFNNMGMNFYDIAIARVHQFDGVRFNYTRKKTESEGDFFSIKQNQENLKILEYYIKGKSSVEYIFPIIKEEKKGEEIFRAKRDKLKWFNNNIKKIAVDLGIEKNLSTYTPRDTWTNIGLKMGIDIRKISSGLGHSSVEITEKHYSQMIQEKILDEINEQITGASIQRPNTLEI